MLVTRDSLDRRSLSSKMFDAQVASIKADLGDADLSTIETQLIENFAGLSVMINALTVDLLLGKSVDLSQLCALNSTAVRVASRLGLRRRAKDVSPPSLSSYLAERTDENEDHADGD